MKDWTLKTWATNKEDVDRVVNSLKDDGYTVEVTQLPVLKQYFVNEVLTAIFWIQAKITGGEI